MSRSGYSDDCEDVLALGRWRACVASTLRGKRGQAFLKEILAAMDSMPIKRLVRNVLENDGFGDRYEGYTFQHPMIVGADELVDKTGQVAAMGEVCAMGAAGRARGMDMRGIDPDDPPQVAAAFGVSEYLVAEIAYMNDEAGFRDETPEQRWTRMRAWVSSKIKPAAEATA
jgi:hypothetical protein